MGADGALTSQCRCSRTSVAVSLGKMAFDDMTSAARMPPVVFHWKSFTEGFSATLGKQQMGVCMQCSQTGVPSASTHFKQVRGVDVNSAIQDTPLLKRTASEARSGMIAHAHPVSACFLRLLQGEPWQALWHNQNFNPQMVSSHAPLSRDS